MYSYNLWFKLLKFVMWFPSVWPSTLLEVKTDTHLGMWKMMLHTIQDKLMLFALQLSIYLIILV